MTLEEINSLGVSTDVPGTDLDDAAREGPVAPDGRTWNEALAPERRNR